MKLAAWKTKKPDRHFWMSDLKFSKRTFYRSIHSLTLLPLRGIRVNRTGSGTSHLTQFVKEHFPLSSRRATIKPYDYSIGFLNVKQQVALHGVGCGLTPCCRKSLRRFQPLTSSDAG
jgi:hypothetical protein